MAKTEEMYKQEIRKEDYQEKLRLYNGKLIKENEQLQQRIEELEAEKKVDREIHINERNEKYEVEQERDRLKETIEIYEDHIESFFGKKTVLKLQEKTQQALKEK